ncbi:hypothetical protein IscW_ISCW015961 [Ixodes scapularis]|uniref:C3H1-type domain-containing protein n=1 Tax=Ixodes scapularis TaxID=6945 RepID=B7P2I4_IXOSC|nr:hypothetical protein IscW_ISCW015961 [Ixodes scapularis]|eukprot:XP_002402385.1 hypothetical protein IscW_ISCW015961 [Ixodes scapularis]
MATAWRWLLKLKTFGYSGGTDPDDPVSQADLEEGEIIDSEKRKRKKRKKDPEGGEPKPHHQHPHGGPMPPREFGSPGPYDDGFMQLLPCEERLAYAQLRALVLEEMRIEGHLLRARSCDTSPRGCNSPDGGPGGPECPQEGMGGPPHQGFPQGGRGAHRGRGGKPHPMDMRRGPPKKKRRKKLMGGARGNKRGGGGGGDGSKSRSVCKFYLESKCVKVRGAPTEDAGKASSGATGGAECPFSHDAPQARKRDMCKFYLSGYCARGEHCSFMHQEFPCKFFHTGAKCFADASCRFSHQPLTEETQRLLGRYLDNSHGPPRMEEDNGGPPDRGDGDMGPPEDRGDPRGPPERGEDRGEGGPPPGEEEFLGCPPHMLKRPSLLGSPPRHVKEAAESWRMQFLGGPPGPPGVPFTQQGPPMMSPPQGTAPDGLSTECGGMPMAGGTPPHGGHPGMGPLPLCLDEGFGPGPMPMGGAGPHPGGFCSPDISSPPLQDQGPSFIGDPRSMGSDGMPQMGVFFDPSQDQSMSPPPQQQQPPPPSQHQQQSIPGLTLTEFEGSRSSPLPPQQTAIPGLDLVDQDSAQSPSRQGGSDDAEKDANNSDDEMWQPSERKGLPPNLPWRQRQLFLRIQQQQKEQRAAEEGGALAAESPSHPAEAEKEEQGSKGTEVLEEEKKAVAAVAADPVEESSAPAKCPGGTAVPPLLPTPSVAAAPSPGTINFAEMMSRIEQQVPSQSQTNFWKHLFSSVPASATTPAVESAPVPTPPTPAPPASRDPRRARAEAQQLPKAPTDVPQSSRDPRLREKLPLPPPPKTEVTFVESKDGDAPYRLVSILRALPNYDDVARGGSLPQSKLRSDPRFANSSSTPARKKDSRRSGTTENPRCCAEVIGSAPGTTDGPKTDPRKAAAMAAASTHANGGTAVPPIVRIDPRLARRLEQMQQKQQQQTTTMDSSSPAVKKDEEMEVTEPIDTKPPPPPPPKRDPRQKSKNVRNPRGGLVAHKNRMDYASPLSSYESEGDRPSGYSSYQRRPQPRPPVPPAPVDAPPLVAVPLPVALPSPVVPTPSPAPQIMPPQSAIISDALLCDADQAIKSLKDVFKTKDPTASPFC